MFFLPVLVISRPSASPFFYEGRLRDRWRSNEPAGMSFHDRDFSLRPTAFGPKPISMSTAGATCEWKPIRWGMLWRLRQMARSNRREAGRRRLAMRLPQMRNLIMEASDRWQLELFEAYQIAVETRDALRRQPFNSDLARECDETCSEIEQHIVRAMSCRDPLQL